MKEVLFSDIVSDAAFFAFLVSFVMFLLGYYVYDFRKSDLIAISLLQFSFVALVIICCSYISGFGMIVWFLFLIAALMIG